MISLAQTKIPAQELQLECSCYFTPSEEPLAISTDQNNEDIKNIPAQSSQTTSNGNLRGTKVTLNNAPVKTLQSPLVSNVGPSLNKVAAQATNNAIVNQQNQINQLEAMIKTLLGQSAPQPNIQTNYPTNTNTIPQTYNPYTTPLINQGFQTIPQQTVLPQQTILSQQNILPQQVVRPNTYFNPNQATAQFQYPQTNIYSQQNPYFSGQQPMTPVINGQYQGYPQQNQQAIYGQSLPVQGTYFSTY